MKWSPQQSLALSAVEKWFRGNTKQKPIFRIFGYAGTGKTTLARHFAEAVDGDVKYAAFTGKAAHAMRNNGCDGASTIHKLIYFTDSNSQGDLITKLNRKSPLRRAKLLIIDECSMVNEEIARDILSFNVPILVLGDPAQLPPVDGAGFFTETKPDIMLTEIHRQAKDNPIIFLATKVREGGYIDYGNYGESRVINKISYNDILETDQIIVGKNKSRNMLNKKMRELLKHETVFPEAKDKLICLKNDADLGIYNGSIMTCSEFVPTKGKSNFFHMRVNDEDDVDKGNGILVKTHKSFFDQTVAKPQWKVLKNSQQFDYGYAITAHKSQGSQWSIPLVFDESFCFREHAIRWLYTAITRAQHNITVYRP